MMVEDCFAEAKITMLKKFFHCLFLCLCALCVCFAVVACAKEENKVSFQTLTVDGLTVKGVLSNEVQTFSFLQEITVEDGITYVVSLDEFGIQTVVTKTVPLSAGDNTFYIIAMDGDISTVYTVVLRRKPMYTVVFNTNGGTAVQSQSVEEGNYVIAPTETIEKHGYTFTGWDYDFSEPITGNITITASWTPHTDTAYKVEYYFENLDGQYLIDNTKTENKTATSGSPVSIDVQEVAEVVGFTVNEYMSKLSGEVNGNGSLVLKVYYQRKTGRVYLESDTENVGYLSSDKYSYKYGATATITASTYGGYTFVGWYDENGEQVTSELSYTFEMPAENVTYTAKWEIATEMKNFEFTSTATTCEITGVKDKTVTEIIIPDNVTSISYQAFGYCSSLTSVVIGDGVTSIGNYAFCGCSSLTEVVIPDNVTRIGQGEFYKCSSLTIYCETESQPSGWDIEWNLCDGSIDKYFTCPVVWNCNENEVADDGYIYAVIDGVRYGLYSDGTAKVVGQPRNIVTANIAESVEYKGNTYTVTSIGNYAFEYCSSLTEIVIPDNVTSVGDYAFRDCSSLTIYCKAESQPSGWESNWSSACPVVWNCNENEMANDGYIYAIINGVRYGLYSDETAKVVRQPRNIVTANIAESVEYQGITYNVTSIGYYAFSGCSGLTEIIIPDSVTSIGYQAFYNCSSLTEIVIPDSVTSIGQGAFFYCDSLTIYCEATKKPSGWDDYWNTNGRPVVWGYSAE